MRDTKPYNILYQRGTAGVGSQIMTSDYRNPIITIVGNSSDADLVVEVRGAIRCKRPDGTTILPDLSQSAGPDNPWTTLQAIDLSDGSKIDGDTGIAVAGNLPSTFEVNINKVDVFTLAVRTATEGSVSAYCVLTDNQ